MSIDKSFDMRLTPHERREIERLARARGLTMKEAILEAVRQRIVEIEEVNFVPTGRLKGAEHLIGCFDGPDDPSTNPSHMEGYGS